MFKWIFLVIAGLVAFPSIVSAEEMAPAKFYNISALPPKHAVPVSAKVKEIYAPNIIGLETGESVRLLGIEASRKIDVNRKAIEFMTTEVKGKTIRLEYDKKMRDDMGRLMAYITLETTPAQTGTLQEDLLWRGYVYSSKKYPCKQYRRYRFYEKGAKKSGRGVWEGIH